MKFINKIIVKNKKYECIEVIGGKNV